MIKGLDSLRILALIAVTWQHAASALGFYEDMQWRGISPGQVGVGIFCAVSGFLAFSTTNQNVGQWLINRIIRIFPAYWVATVVAFILTLFVSDKSVSFGLFLSQMAGIGYFTHGWALVNVVSWFISLLLLCYLIAAMALKCGRPSLVLLFVFMVSVLLCVTRLEVALSRHMISFVLGGLIAFCNEKRLAALISLVFIIFGLSYDPQFFYSGTAVFLLILILLYPVEEPRLIKISASYSYEYFLIHGIFLVGIVKFVPYPVIAITLAIILASVCAILLSHFVSTAAAIFQRNFLNISTTGRSD
jgi:peptidoglycan/LPS O-acetylase OafA/YrhL